MIRRRTAVLIGLFGNSAWSCEVSYLISYNVRLYVDFLLARVHMRMNVSVFPKEMDVFWGYYKLFSHQTAYPGGTEHLLSGTKLKSPQGKTDHPVQCEATASDRQMN